MGIEKLFCTLGSDNIFCKPKAVFERLDKQPINILYFDFTSIIHNIDGKISEFFEKMELHMLDKREFPQPAVNLTMGNITIGDIFQIIQKKYDEVMTMNISELKKYIELRYDDLMIECIELFIKNLTLQIENIEEIIIALEGIPTASKIIEQMRRRYMRMFEESLKHKIKSSQYRAELSRISIGQHNRLYFEENKIRWDRAKIASKSKFMGRLMAKLSSLHIQGASIKIRVLGSDIYGEAESKIIYDIKDNYSQYVGKKVSIYSPDSDVILLTCILQNDIIYKNIDINVDIIRYNSQNDDVEYVVIKNMMFNIIDHVNELKKTIISDELEIDAINVINDLMFIFTIFGNDFIPKIPTIDVNNDMQIIIQSYVRMI